MKKILKILLLLLVIRWTFYCIALAGWISSLAELSIVQVIVHAVTSLDFWPKVAQTAAVFYKVFGVPSLFFYAALQIVNAIAVRGKPGAAVLPPPPAKHRVYVRIVDGVNEDCIDIGNCHQQTIDDGITITYDANAEAVCAEVAGGKKIPLYSTSWRDVGRFKVRVARYDGARGTTPQKARVRKLMPCQIKFSVIKKEAL